MTERERAMLGQEGPDFYAQALLAAGRFTSEEAARRTIVKAEEMVWEDSPQGRIKHMVNAGMNTREHCLDIYQQYLEPGGHSGMHRHFSEEVLYIVEGEGYDLHWDVVFDCKDEYEWGWADEPKRFTWKTGDFVYIPPFVNHQHFATGASGARVISMTNRIVRLMGFDGLAQLANASCYHP